MRHLSPKPLALAAALLCQLSAHGQAVLPTGATVANGVVSINTFRDGMQITSSPGAIINWSSFSISNGQTVRFDQLTAGSAVLNRVTGSSASNILGTLQSNGRVFLLNPNGIVFGAGSRVDTAGLLASTLNISDEDFLAGNYRFSCFNSIACESGVDVLNPSNNRIVLKDGSEITTRNAGHGGQVWLIARDKIISEKGSKVDAPSGQVIAAAAREVTVVSPAFGQMTFTLTGPAGSQIDLSGDIAVERGAAGFFADNVRLAGKVLARSEVDAAGQIVVRATNEIRVEDDARLSVSASEGADAGAIRLNAEHRIKLAASIDIAADGGSETIETAGGRGGLIELKAPEIDVRVVGGSVGALLHVDAFGESDRFSRFGSIVFDESTDYTFAVFDGPSLNGTSSFSSTTNPISRATTITAASVDNDFQALFAGHDGSYLALQRHNVKSSISTITPGVFGSQGSISATEDLQLVLISAEGQSTNLGVLRTNPRATEQMYTQGTGLTKGGWFVQAGDKGYFVSKTGSVLSTMDMPPGNVYASALSSGDVMLSTSTEEILYSAIGQRMAPSVAETVLANQHRKREFAPSFEHINDGIQVIAETGRYSDSSPSVNFRIQYGDSSTPLLFGALFGEISQNGSSSRKLLHEFLPETSRGEFYNVIYSKQSSQTGNGETLTQQQDLKLVKRLFSHGTVTSPTLSSTVLSPTLLASQPSVMNGIASNGGLAPPSGSGPNMPTLPPSTPSPAQPGVGVTAPDSSGSLPPLPYRPAPLLELFTKPALPANAADAPTPAPAGVTAKDVVAVPLTPEQEKELLEFAKKAAEDLLGKDAATRLDEAKTPEQRGRIAQEMLYAMNVGPEMYEVTRDLNNDMRGALFTSLSDLQKLGLADDTTLAKGLKDALEKQREGTNPDGSQRGTAMQEPLLKLQRELAYAFTPLEKERVQRRLTRELILSAKEQAGETVDRSADLVIEDSEGGKVHFTEAGDLVRS